MTGDLDMLMRLSKFMDEWGLSLNDIKVLLWLRENEKARTSDVAEAVGVTRPSMSKSVSILIKRGWLMSDVNLFDRRSFIVQLTPLGIARVRDL